MPKEQHDVLDTIPSVGLKGVYIAIETLEIEGKA